MDTRKTEVKQGQDLLTYLREKGHRLASPCGGKGVCGKCRVRILEGERTLNQPYPGIQGITLDEWQKGWRLACKTMMNEELVVEIPDMWNTDANILVSGDYEVTLQPCIKKIYLELPKPSIEDQTSDTDRLLRALGYGEILDLALVQSIPDIMSEHDYKVTAILHDNTVIGVEGGDTTGTLYGVAVDIGTTTIVGTLIDLNTGDEVGVYSTLNPQKSHGDDVISRIGYTIENEKGLQTLQQLVLDCFNRMFDYFEGRFNVPGRNIYHVNIAGNTVMIHLFSGMPVKNIASVPFQPAATHLPAIKAKELGLNIYPNAVISSLPMIAGYIGADTVACILATDILKKEEYSLLVDIGTNGEIALGNKDGLLACATAAGPALEGAHIQCGMGGVRGAINKIEINEDGICHSTIGDQPAIGICGSGIVDAVAQMRRTGLVDPYGRILSADEASESLPAALVTRIGQYSGKPSFTITGKEEGAANEIFITQKDIREIQLAKAAIAAGIQILMQEKQLSFNDIKKVYLAGGFGNYINHDHAMEIGLLPSELKGKIVPVGNAALTGAKMIVKSRGYMEVAERITKMTKYIELSSRWDFQEIFVENMEFPENR
ncbi:MAG TPA: DUF4445 domain-containing protein [Clostridiales bacterium]|nr:DUF4445 domain-containing protein [Clostridiales bacterium]